MINLYIDFDGVILDTINTTKDLISGLNLDSEVQIRKFYAELDWVKLLETTPIINDGIECIQKIIDSNRFEVAILTHINSLNEAIEKVKYIRRYFDDITIIPVPKAISKTKMVHTKGAILIDDYPMNLSEWLKEGGIGVLFSPQLKQKGYPVINRLDQILDMKF
ncbi:MAG: hypothetical protein PHO63_02440 [Bacilli bacterium]|nr:hypothetical protein [Bacilli bacterium]MDD4809411.1 hypothetical protein [Bacilli bacterium]